MDQILIKLKVDRLLNDFLFNQSIAIDWVIYYYLIILLVVKD